MLESLINQLKQAKAVVLSTHRNSDGDGLGAQLAVFHGLRQLGIQVSIVNPDRPPKKYAFLGTDEFVGVFDLKKLAPSDVALIFDTNDRRLVGPLMEALEEACTQVAFIDHHPILREGPSPTAGSVIDVTAASTGEMAYQLLLGLGVKMSPEIARALYTAVVFDTQMFRYVKSDPRSYLMAAELLKYERDPEAVHRALFATYTIDKMKFFAHALSSVEYFSSGKIALLRLSSVEARLSGLDPDESADVIDLVMNIESVEVGALIREDAPGVFKISLRSKSKAQVLPIAEIFGGGGHPFASGAYVQMNGDDLRRSLLERLTALVESPISAKKVGRSHG